MANVLLAARTTTTDVLNTVSKSTSVLTRSAAALDNLAAVGEAYSESYLDDVRADIKENAGRRQVLRVNRAKHEVSIELLSLKQELEADPELLAIFQDLDDNLFATTAKPAS